MLAAVFIAVFLHPFFLHVPASSFRAAIMCQFLESIIKGQYQTLTEHGVGLPYQQRKLL